MTPKTFNPIDIRFYGETVGLPKIDRKTFWSDGKSRGKNGELKRKFNRVFVAMRIYKISPGTVCCKIIVHLISCLILY